MIRQFGWRDFPLLLRLRNTGQCLDSQLAYTRGPNLISHILQDYFIPGGRAITLVELAENNHSTGLAQLIHRHGDSQARIVFVSPSSAPKYGHLLDALAYAAGEHGAFNLTACVEDRDPAFEHLRSAGFFVYARQHVWQLSATSSAAFHDDVHWNTPQATQVVELSQLYHHILPALVQQVESWEQIERKQLLLYRPANQTHGFASIEHGRMGTWIQLYLGPKKTDPNHAIRSLLSTLRFRRQTSIFITVRTFHSGFESAFAESGFSQLCEQALMVKRLAVGVHHLAHNAHPSIEHAHPEASAPYSTFEGTTASNQMKKTL